MKFRSSYYWSIIGLFVLVHSYAGYSLRDSFWERGNRSTEIFQIAKNLVAGEGFSLDETGPTANNEPIYAGFVAVSFAVFGQNWVAILITQSLLLLFMAFLSSQIASMLFKKEWVSWLAFTGTLFYPFYFTQSLSVSDTVIFTTLLLLAVYLAVRIVSKEEQSSKWYILLGVVLGGLLQTRMISLTLFPGIFLYLLYFRYKAGFWAEVGRLAAAALIMALVCLPWLVRNYNYTEELFITTHGGIEFWFAFNDSTAYCLTNNLSVDYLRHDVEEKVPALAELEQQRFANEIAREYAYNSTFVKQGLDNIGHDPQQALRNIPLKFQKFWSLQKNPRTNSLDENRSSLSYYWDVFYTLYFTPLLLLGILGFWWVTRQYPHSWIFWLLILLFTIAHSLIYGFTRLRVPLDTLLILYASFAIHKLTNGIFQKRNEDPIAAS